MGQSDSKPSSDSESNSRSGGSSVLPAGNTSESSSNPSAKKPACKACCACPETKKARDACIMEMGEENCGDLIEAHKKCMRDMGFNI